MTRWGWLLSVAALSACARPAPPATAPALPASAKVVSTFEGVFDPTSGTISIRNLPVGADAGGGGAALTAFTPWQDGHPGSGPPNTLELVTEASPAPGPDANGCAAGAPSFEGSITVRSFFVSQAFTSVYVQITQVTPSEYYACNSDSPGTTGLIPTYGLWNYGPLTTATGAGNSATKRWKFHFTGGQAFTFQGRILADLAPPPTTGVPEFDWTPALLTMAPHAFQDAATTASHVVWNGTNFADSKNQLAFALDSVLFPATTATVGLWNPAQSLVGSFTEKAFFNATGANLIDTAGGFTVCVKFKPGFSVGASPSKVLVARGHPEAPSGPNLGWALMQMHSEYCFHYQNGTDIQNTMAFNSPGGDPSAWAYDYICGGYDGGTTITSGAHGFHWNGPVGVSGAIKGGTGLPYTIGAYADGTHPAVDQGVYEVIIDSRPVSLTVMNEIVGMAEGRQMVNGAWYVPDPNVVSVPGFVGMDGLAYTLPPGVTVPVSSDGSGLMDAGKWVDYTSVLQEDTSSTGFCIGAELQATGPWAAIAGGLFGGGGGQVFLAFTGSDDLAALSGSIHFVPSFSALTGWAASSRHVVKLCVAGGGAGGGKTMSIWGDDGPGPLAEWPDFASNDLRTGDFLIGRGGYPSATLSGARIARVFACPSSVAASCR